MAVGTIVETTTEARNTADVRSKTFVCTASSTDGTYPALSLTGFEGYYLHSVETIPTAGVDPTDASDYTIKDGFGGDLMGGKGTDAIDSTTYVFMQPYSAIMTAYIQPVVKGPLTFQAVQQGSATNSAVFHLRVTCVKHT